MCLSYLPLNVLTFLLSTYNMFRQLVPLVNHSCREELVSSVQAMSWLLEFKWMPSCPLPVDVGLQFQEILSCIHFVNPVDKLVHI